MPGDLWQQFANLRLLYAYMFAHPGKKLLFMGDEIGQRSEWDAEGSLEWHLLEYAPHQKSAKTGGGFKCAVYLQRNLRAL